MFVDFVKQKYNDYYLDIPRNSKQTIIQSACLSFIVSLVVRQHHYKTFSPTASLVAAGVASLLSLIHSATAPIFKSMGANEQFFHHQLFRFLMENYILNTIGPINHLTNGICYQFIWNSAIYQSGWKLIREIVPGAMTILPEWRIEESVLNIVI